MTRARIVVDGRPYDVVIETDPHGRRTVTVDGHTFAVDAVRADPRGGRAMSVTLDGTSHEVERRDLSYVRVDDTESAFRIDSVQGGAGAGAIGREGAVIHPPMPGKVVALRVAAGEAVEAGQVLLVLEAMKMQNEVTSPAAGVVTEVRVKAGQNVDTKDVLVVLGPPEAQGAQEAAVVA